MATESTPEVAINAPCNWPFLLPTGGSLFGSQGTDFCYVQGDRTVVCSPAAPPSGHLRIHDIQHAAGKSNPVADGL